ncbi:hypothetical protein G3M48_001387 [Beauveria asiatica]|uniref:F-box domain-containing protein n=1 Tax=Beauveria asiatica TaxID=1069075 RepID=A0AAW0RZ48_9HYPO
MPTRPKQSKAAYILNVPVELIILFAQYLQLLDQYRLAQVSIAFRSILKTRFDQHTIAKVYPPEWMFYLATRALELPNHWVCEQCYDIHPYNPQDTPSLAHFNDAIGGCPLKATTPYFRPMVFPYSYHFQNFHLHHRYVQLALKYHRMGGPEGGPFAQRLSRLLADGFHEPMSEEQNFSLLGFQNRGNGRYSWKPKIAGGRFLLMTEIEFVPTELDLLSAWIDVVPAVRMCQHQMWMPLFDRRILDLAVQSTWSAEEENEFRRLTEATGNNLHLAVLCMRRDVLRPRMVSCPHCATDILLRWYCFRGAYKFTATAWHDFGPETSPVSPLWLSKHLNPVEFRLTPWIKWEPGRVRKLWDACH